MEPDEMQHKHQPRKRPVSARVHYPVLKQPRHTSRRRGNHAPRPRTGGPYPSRSRDPGTQQRAPYHFMSLDILHTTTGGTPAHTTGAQPGALKILRRKEVIQPHLPVRLPCYDLVPIADLTLDGSPPRVRPPASGAAHFHDLTGGVYKARERIHRGVADPRLLATPPSRSRVAGSDPN